MATTALMNTYGERQLTLVKGEGVYLWDEQGRRYLDALSGIAVCGLGHSPKALTAAISEQAGTLLHISNLYNTQPSQRLAELLCAQTGMENVFFSNSGAEANEAAIKIARKYGNDQGIACPTIITMHNSFHGRTLATLTATGNQKVKAGFAPLVDGFIHVDYDDIDAIKAVDNPNVVAILVEPIQGEGGVRVPADDYLAQLRTLCDERGWLLMLDEIQTGNGRTGKLYAFQHTDILPDVFTTAKGLGNGLPIGACLARGKAAQVFQPGNHGSTYGGNPLVCHGAYTVIRTLIDDRLIENADTMGTYLRNALTQALAQYDKVRNIRGKGLMMGIELAQPCPELVGLAADAGLLINVTAGNVIRLLPPLVITEAEADQIVAIISQLIGNLAD
jgi:acetylornithine/N-succinyldiaminopimelate aminotransferase